jgi:hypothetical protein
MRNGDIGKLAQETGGHMKRAQIVRVKIEEGKEGLFYATSPDLKGLLVAEPTIDELEMAIPQTISDLVLAMSGDRVVVTKARDTDPVFFPWVAIPAETLEKVQG